MGQKSWPSLIHEICPRIYRRPEHTGIYDWRSDVQGVPRWAEHATIVLTSHAKSVNRTSRRSCSAGGFSASRSLLYDSRSRIRAREFSTSRISDSGTGHSYDIEACIDESRSDACRDYARAAEDAQHYGGGVRQHQEEAGARAEPDRVGNLQRDVERALFVQEQSRPPEAAADQGDADDGAGERGAGAGRERRDH